MGSRVSAIVNRLFDYPIKRKPICFHRQEDFTSTGEPIPRNENVTSEPPTEYIGCASSSFPDLIILG